jgi:hypothetical protein
MRIAPKPIAAERGMALVVVVLATLLMSALGTGLMLNTAAETLVAGNFLTAYATQHAADAVLELAVAELAQAPWNQALNGAAPSDFVDGLPLGERQLANGVNVNLTELVNKANCHKAAPCAQNDLNAVTADRPWGVRNPRWILYSYGPLAAVSPSASGACCYIAAMIADDPADDDGQPWVDGADLANPGGGVLLVRAEAFGQRSAHAVRTATISRRAGKLRILSWRSGGVP